MFTLRLIVAIASLLLAGWFLYDFLQGYLKASGSRWTRFLFAFKGSATIAWARFVAFVGSAGGGIIEMADYANMPAVGDFVRSYFTPQTVMMLMAGIAIISEFARRRFGSGSPT